MEQESNSIIGGIKPKRISTRKWVWFGVLCLAVCIGIIGWFFIPLYIVSVQEETDRAKQTQMQEMIVKKVAEAEAQPFLFTLVPDAPTLITLNAPATSTEEDLKIYKTLVTSAGVIDPIDPEIVKKDIAFNLPFQGMTLGEFINKLPEEQRYKLFQMSDELRQLTTHFNELYKRPSFKDRAEGVVEVTPSATVYPSLRAVEGFFAIHIMSEIDPNSSELYTEIGEDFVKRGILYGMYGSSDADAYCKKTFNCP